MGDDFDRASDSDSEPESDILQMIVCLRDGKEAAAAG
jgi:hypothetical protein